MIGGENDQLLVHGFHKVEKCHCLHKYCRYSCEEGVLCPTRQSPAMEEIASGWKEHPALAMTLYLGIVKLLCESPGY